MFDLAPMSLKSTRWVLLLFVVALLLSFNGGIDVSCTVTTSNPISASDQCNGSGREPFAQHLAHHTHPEPSLAHQITPTVLVSPQSVPLPRDDARLPQPRTLPAPEQPPRSA